MFRSAYTCWWFGCWIQRIKTTWVSCFLDFHDHAVVVCNRLGCYLVVIPWYVIYTAFGACWTIEIRPYESFNGNYMISTSSWTRLHSNSSQAFCFACFYHRLNYILQIFWCKDAVEKQLCLDNTLKGRPSRGKATCHRASGIMMIALGMECLNPILSWLNDHRAGAKEIWIAVDFKLG